LNFKSLTSEILKLLFTNLLALISIVCCGQDLCLNNSYALGGFDLSSSTVCLPQTLSVIDRSGGSKLRYVFNYLGEGIDEVNTIATTQTSFDYASLAIAPEIFTVLQIGELNGKPTIACKNVTVRPSNVAVYSFTPCESSGTLAINIPQTALNDFDSYEILLNGSLIRSVTSSQLPIQEIRNTGLPAQLKVEGKYNLASKGCSTPIPSSTVTPFFSVIGGVDRPFNPNISEVKLISPTKVNLKFSGAYHPSSFSTEQYKLYGYPSGTLPNPSNVSVSNIVPGRYTLTLTDSTKSYCFSVQRDKTACGNFREYSTEICTIPLKTVTFSPYRHKLDWVRYQNVLFGIPNNIISNISAVQQILSTENGTYLTPIAISSNLATHTINPIDCKKRYCYRLQVKTSGQISFLKFQGQSISNLICLDRAGLTAPVPEDVYVSTNDDNKNAIYFNGTPSWPIEVEKWMLYKYNNSNYSKYDSTNHPANLVLDPQVVDSKASYKVAYLDKCGTPSVLSDSVSSVYVTFKEPNQLVWNKDLPFDQLGIDSYEVQYFDESSNSVRKSVKESNTEHGVGFEGYENEVKLRVKTLPDNGSTRFSYSNILTVNVPSNLILPNVFTPNGDLQNDLLSLKGNTNSVKSYSLEIFNSFGEKILHFKDPKETWDGTLNGKSVPVGVFFYKMRVVLNNNEILRKEGALDILK
jgi:gliding motility-associated-like protein